MTVNVAPWQTKSRPRMLIASKAAFLENYLVVSTWILNGSSIECQPFSFWKPRDSNFWVKMEKSKIIEPFDPFFKLSGS